MEDSPASISVNQAGVEAETLWQQRSVLRALATAAVGLALAVLPQQASLAPPTTRIEVECNGYRAQIVCGRSTTSAEDDSRACNKNILQFMDPNGKTVVAAPPPITKKFSDNKRPVMLPDTAPDQLSCVRARDGTYYVEVRYSRGNNGFTNEMFHDWFHPDGTRLTSLGVPLSPTFRDPTAGMSWKQLPKPISIEGDG